MAVGRNFFKRLKSVKIRLSHTPRDILIISVIVVFLGLIFFAAQNLMVAGDYRTEYEGKIVDKAIRLHESQEGSWMERYLVIEDRSRTRSQVVVPAGTYDRAKVGMWITKGQKGFELTSPEDSGTQ